MNIGSVQPSEVALQGLTNVYDKRVKLQVALLRKTLDSQQDQAAELIRMMEGKGQVVDIRV